MAKTLDFETLPEVARKLRQQASDEGIPVEECVRRAMANLKAPTNSELFDILAALPPIDIDSAADIRDLRGPLPDVDDDRR